MNPTDRNSLESTPHERLHALDALRGIAMALGVYLHAAMGWVEGVPEWFWPITEPSDGFISLSVMFIHAWRMEVFFLVSGFFTAMLLARRGMARMLRNRSARILLPFAIALLTIQPLCAVVWGWGFAQDLPDVKTTDSIVWWLKWAWDPSDPGRPWHLWFLYELCWLVAGATLVALLARISGGRATNAIAGALASAVAFCCRNPLGSFLLAIPLLGALLLQEGWSPQPNPSLIPRFTLMLPYVVPFGAGWLLYRRRDGLLALGRRWWMHLIIAVPMFVVHLVMVIIQAEPMKKGEPTPEWFQVLGRSTSALLTMSLTLTIIGLFMAVLSSPSDRIRRAMRYLSDSAYWVYLAHLPLVVVVAILMRDLEWHPILKLAINVTLSSVILLVTYELLVRHTLIGRLLNGKRVPWRPGRAVERN